MIDENVMCEVASHVGVGKYALHRKYPNASYAQPSQFERHLFDAFDATRSEKEKMISAWPNLFENYEYFKYQYL